jgi:hypothetical protein
VLLIFLNGVDSGPGVASLTLGSGGFGAEFVGHLFVPLQTAIVDGRGETGARFGTLKKPYHQAALPIEPLSKRSSGPEGTYSFIRSFPRAFASSGGRKAAAALRSAPRRRPPGTFTSPFSRVILLPSWRPGSGPGRSLADRNATVEDGAATNGHHEARVFRVESERDNVDGLFAAHVALIVRPGERLRRPFADEREREIRSEAGDREGNGRPRRKDRARALDRGNLCVRQRH